jgi:DNA repair protein RadC
MPAHADDSREERLSDEETAEAHFHGHRERLRTRFLTNGADSLHDYEVLELLLFAALPRRDVKPLAKDLLKAFGDLWSVVHAPPDEMRRKFPKLTDNTIAAITIVGAAALRMTRQQILDKPVLSSWQRLIDYCEGAMSNERTEQFRLLFLDRKNVLIADEVQQRGTVDHTPVYPREVVKRALELGACAIILVHNHPSGDPTPSRADIDMTKEIAKAAGALGVVVHDHLIIGKGRHASFKTMGLL